MSYRISTLFARIAPSSLGLGFILSAGILLAGCTLPSYPSKEIPAVSPTPVLSPSLDALSPAVAPALSEAEARKSATNKSNDCSAVGTIGATEIYNPNSQTWWFTLTPSQPKAGCHPACVVSAQGQIEVNWRCTGLKPVN